MAYKRILTIQDISCFGQCSLTVALPVISACGIETCILPSAVLSTHTGGFSGYTFRDLTDDIPLIAEHWKKENITFDAFYTGYLGNSKQIDYVISVMNSLGRKGALKIVDPAMADNGKLYTGFDSAFVNEMKKLVSASDIVLPNITEACLLTGSEYLAEYDEKYILEIYRKLRDAGAETVVLTGVGFEAGKTGVAVFENGNYSYYQHKKISRGSHGTGDVYASAFTGLLLNGRSVFDSAKGAADFTVKCIENTVNDPSHTYGVKFETALGTLIRACENSEG